MTPWLHATVLALVVGSSTAVLPPGEWPTNTIRPYDTEPRPLRSASASPSPTPVGLTLLTYGLAPGSAGPAQPPTRALSASPSNPSWGLLAAHALPLTPTSPPPPPADHPTGSAQPHGGPHLGSPSHPASDPPPDHGPRHTPTSPGRPSDSEAAHGPRRASASPSSAPSPSAATPSRAGSRAGEGRERPGRREEPTAEDDGSTGTDSTDTDTGTDTGTGTGTDTDDGDLAAVSEPPHETPAASAPQRAARTAAKVFILPLGTGLVLIGLGLWLALFALRLRRG